MNAIQTVMMDFASLSILLLIGYFIRKKVKWMQNLFLPAALVAGVLGLLLGPQGLGQISPYYFPLANSIAQWPGVLITLVFSVLFLGAKPVNFNEAALSTTVLAGISHMSQIVVGLGCTIGLALVYTDLPLGFGLTPAYGFYGGHGTAIAAGTIFKDLGWNDGMAVANTMATVGLISGIVLGMILINIAIRRGYAQLVNKPSEIPSELKEGYLPLEKRSPIGMGVSSNDVLDPFCFQLAWAGLICLCAYILQKNLVNIHPQFKNIPAFAIALAMGFVVWSILKRLKMEDYIDRPSMNRISGLAMEYLTCAAIATISLKAVALYFVPMAVTIVMIIVSNFFVYYYFGRKLFRRDWFERSICAYGQGHGVLATGLLLLRVVDPAFSTSAAGACAAASVIGYLFAIPYVAFGPWMAVTLGASKLMALSMGLLIMFVILGRVFFWQKNDAPQQQLSPVK
ncbi:MAG: hypothetical protein GX423_00830 [Nitrospiraceae bacterium]|nr:hypothetical protein [Nitrospiraceae bacterium]